MPVDANDAFTLILEPVQRCNLRCLYCYSDVAGAGVMSRQTLQTALEKTARYAEGHGFREIHILWHGGEPLLAGLGFFQAAVKILDGLASDLRFHHYLQTNGLLLDHDFCAFFRDHEFQIGISLDGPQVLHDSMRIGADGQGSHAAVLGKVRLLEQQGVSVGFNAVVPGGAWVRRRQSTGSFRAWGMVSGLTRWFRGATRRPRRHTCCSQGNMAHFFAAYSTHGPVRNASGSWCRLWTCTWRQFWGCALRMSAARNLCRVAPRRETLRGCRAVQPV